jgi:superfamily I DNA and/or RNA helicase
MNRKFQNTKLDWRDVDVGSTEEFQGREKRVVIISTVRSKEEFIDSDLVHKLGFLKNPKRSVTNVQSISTCSHSML